MLARLSMVATIAISAHVVGASSLMARNGGLGVMPPCNPPASWQTWEMSRSTISMQCNGSGWSSPERGSQLGIVSYDWSNTKKQWAATKPMNCEENLVTQAEMTKKLGGPDNHVFVYRNVVKALPWFTSVRKILDDPAYSGFFLRFSTTTTNFSVPQCAPEDPNKCSVFYHDQEQTPEVPTASQPHPDGSCTDDDCDCGTQPCGEYLFDHRNGTMLRDWIVNELFLNKETALGNPAVDGFFIDDYWCSNLLCEETNNQAGGCPCHDPVQGPTEVDKNSQHDMGLSDADIKAITLGWSDTMAAVEAAIIANNGYTWSLVPKQQYANAAPTKLSSDKAECIAQLEDACQEGSVWQDFPVLFGFTPNGTTLPQLKQDLAFFLLARGPFAYAGWGVWGMTWPFNPEPAHGGLPPSPHGVAFPDEFSVDYGTPLDKLCTKKAPGVYQRRWSKANVELDCNTFTGSVTLL